MLFGLESFVTRDFGRIIWLEYASVRCRLFILGVVCGGLLIRAFELTGWCLWPTRCTKFVVQRLCLQVQEARVEQ